MIVCSCHVVRAEDIRTEVRLGATTADDIAARCQAGTRCGGCRTAVECVVADELDRAAAAVGAGTRD